MATPEDHRLVISGVVYASDFATPLPGALIEVLLVAQESQYDPAYPPYHVFHDWFQADAAGRYKATLPKPDDEGIIHLYYRTNYQDDCPLKLQLLVIDEATLSESRSIFPELRRFGLGQKAPAGPLLRGPIDVVLPVPSPMAVKGK
jgi:hypothetical protein